MRSIAATLLLSLIGLSALLAAPAITAVALAPAQAGDQYREYDTGGFVRSAIPKPAHRLTLQWASEAGASYYVETSVNMNQRWQIPNQWTTGDRWVRCSTPVISQGVTTMWVSGVPYGHRFFRVIKQ